MIMGTSTCHMVLGPDERPVAGMCGSVEDGILPGFVGYEAGQSCVGDAFAWFVEQRRAAGRPRGRASGGRRHPRPPAGAGLRRTARGVRPARARLVERQSIGPRRCRAEWPAPRRHAVDDRRGDLPGARRGDGVRHTRHRRCVPRRGRRRRRGRGLRWPGRQEPGHRPALRRHRRPAVPGQRLGPGAGPRVGDVRGRGGRRRGRRTRHDPGGLRSDGPRARRGRPTDARASASRTTSCTANTSDSTTTSGAARTTS